MRIPAGGDRQGEAGPDGAPSLRERRLALALLLACLGAYGYFVYRGPHHNPDSRLALTYAVVERRALDIDPDAGGTLDRALVSGPYGTHFYTDKAPGLSFWLVPFHAGVRQVLPPSLLGPEDRFLARFALTFLGLGIPAALFGAFLFSWMRGVERRAAPRLVVAAGYALATPAYPFAVSAFGHVPAGMLLFGAFAALFRAPEVAQVVGPGAGWRGVLAGALLGLAVAVEYPAAVAAVPIVLYGLWGARGGRERRTVALRLLAGAAPPLLLLALYQQAVFGRPWATGYAFLDPASPYAAGQGGGFLGVGLPRPDVALALLVGLRRGLLVHAPWLVLTLPGAVLLWRRARAEALTALGVLGALLAANSGYAYWDGGASWGPRHLVPALPFLALLVLPAAARWTGTASALVALSGLLTLAAVATRTLPDPALAFPLRDELLPKVLRGAVTNNWGLLGGLVAWRGVVPLLGAILLFAGWATGWRRAAGWLVAGAWALLALATLHRAYLEYSEGYYLYLGARLAAGARLYADAASTQPPLLPVAVSLLWRLAPDVYLPRLLAILLYLATALLAGRLARRLADHLSAAASAAIERGESNSSSWGRSPQAPRPNGAVSAGATCGVVATVVAALLPLGAGTVQVLDANAVLAPLGLGVALLAPRRPLLAGLLAAAGLGTKLTFLPLAVAPAVALYLVRSPRSRGPGPLAWVRSREGALYVGGCALGVVAQLCLWLLISGPVALDGILGELESPFLPLGAALALTQLAILEGPLLLLAAWGWWGARPNLPGHQVAGAPVVAVAWCCALGAAVLPLFAVHQGTFVGVARPAEPFVAVYAALALPLLATRVGRVAVPAVLGAALVLPLWHDLRSLATRPVIDPQPVLNQLASTPAAGDVVAPPYYAALAGRRMLFDYADWTVWGMRSAAGVAHERDLARRLVLTLEGGHLAIVAADFRLAYIPGVPEALERGYVRAGDDGDAEDRSVALFVPR